MIFYCLTGILVLKIAPLSLSLSKLSSPSRSLKSMATAANPIPCPITDDLSVNRSLYVLHTYEADGEDILDELVNKSADRVFRILNL